MGWLKELLTGDQTPHIHWADKKMSVSQFCRVVVPSTLDGTQRLVTTLIKIGQERKDDNVFMRMEENKFGAQVQVWPLLLAAYGASIIFLSKDREKMNREVGQEMWQALHSGNLDSRVAETVHTVFLKICSKLHEDLSRDSLSTWEAPPLAAMLLCQSFVEAKMYADKPKIQVSDFDLFSVTSILQIEVTLYLGAMQKQNIRVED